MSIEASAVTDVAFWIIAALAIASALLVVTIRDVFKAAAFLAASFLMTAGLFVLLRAEFLAVVQILIYVGAVSILIIFTVMLVRNVPGGNRTGGPFYVIAGGAAAVLLALGIAYSAFNSNWTDLDEVTRGDERVEAALVGQYQAEDAPGDGQAELVTGPAADQETGQPGVFRRTANNLGTLFIRDYVLAFEVVSVVLLAALIGALALARERGAAT
ncbi:MAG: NADH-quinone oxidoreductase subunit J [Chloroflexi bacterium]|nr:NADH-quinone oxidoreductase subunit J [Chloroflexota bacterium]